MVIALLGVQSLSKELRQAGLSATQSDKFLINLRASRYGSAMHGLGEFWVFCKRLGITKTQVCLQAISRWAVGIRWLCSTDCIAVIYSQGSPKPKSALHYLGTPAPSRAQHQKGQQFVFSVARSLACVLAVISFRARCRMPSD